MQKYSFSRLDAVHLEGRTAVRPYNRGYHTQLKNHCSSISTLVDWLAGIELKAIGAD